LIAVEGHCRPLPPDNTTEASLYERTTVSGKSHTSG
jgi:hypothetical protein